MANLPASLTQPLSIASAGIQYGNIGNFVYSWGGSQTQVWGQAELRRVSDDVQLWIRDNQIGTSATSMSFGYNGPTLTTGVSYRVRGRFETPNAGGATAVFGPFTSFVFSATSPAVSTISPSGEIGTTTPTLRFGLSYPVTDNFASYQLQVRRVSDAAIMWDTGTVLFGGGGTTATSVDVVYAGSALSIATAYEWRVRATKVSGWQSSYTAWQSFTPQIAPNAPTITAPTANQVIDTLTPTFTGTYNQGNGSVEDAFQYRIRQNNVLIYQSGDVSAAIATGQVYGTSNSGSTPSTAPALQWGTNYTIDMRSKDDNAQYSAWTSQRAFSTNAAPTSPTNLSPNGSVTGDTTPTLSWQHNDPNGDAQTEVEIELWETVSTDPVTGYDPKQLSQSGQTHTVTETLEDNPATEYSWRVRTMGTSGPGYGPWSAVATFTVSEVPTVTLTAPTQSEVLAAPSYLVEWTFTGGTQQDYRVIVYADDNTTIVYDSGVVAGEDEEALIPSGFLRNNNTYYVQVLARDTVNVQGESSRVMVTTSWAQPPVLTGFTVTAVQ